MKSTETAASSAPDVASVRIRVPASTSNLGPAFDAAGIALRLYLYVEVARRIAERRTSTSGGRTPISYRATGRT